VCPQYRVHFILLVILFFILIGCDFFAATTITSTTPTTATTTTTSLISVPDISGVNESSAETILINNSLIPVIEYLYSNSVDEELVIRTDPEAFEEVDKDTRITLYVSKGEWPPIIYSESSHIQWYNVSGSSGDYYSFYSPEISYGMIKIEITVIYNSSYSMEWMDDNNDGYGYGSASLSSNLSDSVHLWIEYENRTISSGVEQTITIFCDADELGVNKPTELYTEWCVKLDNESYIIQVSFDITW